MSTSSVFLELRPFDDYDNFRHSSRIIFYLLTIICTTRQEQGDFIFFHVVLRVSVSRLTHFTSPSAENMNKRKKVKYDTECYVDNVILRWMWEMLTSFPGLSSSSSATLVVP